MASLAIAITFVLTGAVVAAAGTVLARNGDVIAARTRLGGLWVGSLFLAIATSLPELTTDIAAVRLGQPDLAAGDLFGSSMANMLILALVTLLPAGRDLFARATIDHALYAALAIILTCIAGAVILVQPRMMILNVGPGSLLILAVYLVGTRSIFRHTVIAQAAGTTAEMRASAPESGGLPEADGPASAGVPALGPAVLRFLAASLVILLAAPRFASTASDLAEITGLGTTFVGTWLVGASTSLPELVTSVAAVRLGAYDLAAGNLFGSNAFNMTVFVILDAVHRGPLLADISPVHVVTSLVAIALMGAGLAALVYRAKRRFALLEPSGGAMLLMYVAGLALVYASTR
jgi:cation:H+ antiporter